MKTFPFPVSIRTTRLHLRQWQDKDLAPFAALNADPEVTQFFPAPLTQEQSNTMARRCQTLIDERGWGLWAVESLQSKAFVGMIGLHIPTAPLPFAPCVEIGWRLGKEHWGNGYATEGAIAALEVAFRDIELEEVVAFTSVHNTKSEAVMQRIGMKRDEHTFAHPAVSSDNWLSQHCLYRIGKQV
ncbi:GNAT family N-acetyltransferase [Methylobacillus pratensis]